MTFDIRATDLATLNSLTKYPSIPTYHTLDQGAGGQPEGIVLRTPTRSVIVKARFKDYERALKLRGRTR